MNGVRSTYMRKGYLLTALAAAVLLAASSGTAYAQRVTIGFVETSGSISEKAFLNVNSLEDPQRITVRVNGLRAGSQREPDIGNSLGNVTITPDKNVWIGRVTSSGYAGGDDATSGEAGALARIIGGAVESFVIHSDRFNHSDEVVLVVAQSPALPVVSGGADITDGTGDDNWVNEMVELKLEVDPGASDPASVSPDTFTLTVNESDIAPVAKFLQPNFTLSEQSSRTVQLDVAAARGAARVPPAAMDPTEATRTADTFGTEVISVRVSNHHLVMFGNGTNAVTDPLTSCPARGTSKYNKILFRIDLTTEPVEWSNETGGSFANTGLLETVAATSIDVLAGTNGAGGVGTADVMIYGCGDGAGIRDPSITLTILRSNLENRRYGNITIGEPLTISIDSDEAAPTLSFSPTDVTIDEGGMTSTVLLAEGPNADDVGMVKLSVEGDAMVSLMQDGEMLEEMGGYVYVDLDNNSSVRLEAMSHSDPDLMDGDMADKVWKLMEGGTDGAHIGEGSWFKVVVRGSTAVPALPLVGQLLLALFLMAGGARLYRRRQG